MFCKGFVDTVFICYTFKYMIDTIINIIMWFFGILIAIRVVLELILILLGIEN